MVIFEKLFCKNFIKMAASRAYIDFEFFLDGTGNCCHRIHSV